jgi:hypothetical protein
MATYPLFKPEIGEKILKLLAEGIGLSTVCKQLRVDRSMVRDWAAKNPDFSRAVQFARREGYEVWADEILDIGDVVRGTDNNAAVQAARLAVDSRKWLLAKLHPERYGDKVELTGKDGRDLLPASSEASIPRLMTVLAVLLPQMANSELHNLATSMAAKLGSPNLPAIEIAPDPVEPNGDGRSH